MATTSGSRRSARPACCAPAMSPRARWRPGRRPAPRRTDSRISFSPGIPTPIGWRWTTSPTSWRAPPRAWGWTRAWRRWRSRRRRRSRCAPGRRSRSDMEALRELILGNLGRFDRIAIADDAAHRPAAVAILLSPVDGEPTFALTRRALTMRRGAGNYALPGGGFEPGEDAIAAALRETSEELGVAMPRDAALGLLDDF